MYFKLYMFGFKLELSLRSASIVIPLFKHKGYGPFKDFHSNKYFFFYANVSQSFIGLHAYYVIDKIEVPGTGIQKFKESNDSH